jgi:hypothetical protein
MGARTTSIGMGAAIALHTWPKADVWDRLRRVLLSKLRLSDHQVANKGSRPAAQSVPNISAAVDVAGRRFCLACNFRTSQLTDGSPMLRSTFDPKGTS